MATATTIPVAAHVVGDAFVKQYYTVLHHSPQVVHRFYTDLSKLTRAEAAPDGIIHTAVAQKEINSKVMSLDQGNMLAEIKTIDSQESLNGAVLVLVTGALETKNHAKKSFVQTFFLAPQEKGYYVLNDMLRYLDEEPQSVQSTYMANGNVNVVLKAPPVQADSSQPCLANSHSTDHEVIEPASPPKYVVETSGEEIHDSKEQSEAVETQEPHSAAQEAHPSQSSSTLGEPSILLSTVLTAASAQDEAQSQTPKKSYASILRLMTETPGSQGTSNQNGIPRAASVVVDWATTPAVSSLSLSSSTPAFIENAVDVEHEGNKKSIYVKNLSMYITASQLEEQFVKFGAIIANGINVRSQKQQGFSYAFVEFEDPASAQSAITASPIVIGGRPAFVQEKRPATSRGRGRTIPGRGERLYRNDGMRGLGYYGGRAQGQNFGQDQYFRSQGPAAMQGGSGQNPVASENSGTSNAKSQARSVLQGSSGPRSQRRGAGNQATRNGVASHIDSVTTS